jgi:hypothetical protein
MVVGLMALAMLAIGLRLNTGYVPTPQDASSKMDDALTKTASFAGTAFDLGDGFNPGGVGMPINAVIDVSALTADGATFSFQLTECATSGGSYVAVGPSVAVSATGVVSVPGIVSKRYLKLDLTIASAGGSTTLTYSSWANPNGFATN